MANTGKRMHKGKYTIEKTSSGKKLKGTLLKTFNLGKHRIAVFSVPKGF
jgi:hypothetical protein